ncbi:uncharacterized protein LOC143915097 isoform X2 [Arctopsyche grandis]|uniref:uncharacterized protein LOC143915097 isoform X2 n=1 Tax=Arctopsyche grandis TaxID=121162 RepID=UPI00406D67F6
MFVAFGNPLIDYTVEIDSTEILEKYDLKENGQSELELKKFETLLNEVAQGLQDYPELGAGRCVCLVRGIHRTCVANIGAAGHFSLDYLIETPDLQELLNEAKIVHVEGFFLSNRYPVCQYVVNEVQRKRGKPLCYNLAGSYVIKDLGEESRFMAENADLVFGNEDEFAALGEIYGLKSGEECVLKLHEIWSANSGQLEDEDDASDELYVIGGGNKRMGSFGKIIAMTNGCKPVLVLWGRRNPTLKRYDVPRLSPDAIVDTTGAGDAFIAGFVCGLMKDRQVDDCVSYACKIAATVIGYIGSTPPPGHTLPSIDDC